MKRRKGDVAGTAMAMRAREPTSTAGCLISLDVQDTHSLLMQICLGPLLSVAVHRSCPSLKYRRQMRRSDLEEDDQGGETEEEQEEENRVGEREEKQEEVEEGGGSGGSIRSRRSKRKRWSRRYISEGEEEIRTSKSCSRSGCSGRCSR